MECDDDTWTAHCIAEINRLLLDRSLQRLDQEIYG
jgi:hypothetical protein